MKQYVVDAFTDQIFGGNPAAVCVMERWIPDGLMLNITRENNLSETAFAVKEGDAYHLRWFTPGGEIDLCGHATLATAYVITQFIEPAIPVVHFTTLSGPLMVQKKGGLLVMDFPAFALHRVDVTESMVAAMGVKPVAAYLGRDLLCVFESENDVRNMSVNEDKVKELDGLILHVTAPGAEFDCVSRSFAPKVKIAEDPVCGSGHCHIIPYWAKRLGKSSLTAYQASQRGGTLYCEHKGERVMLSGKAVLYSTADINIA